MRISTAQFFETSTSKYQNNFSSVVKTQDQIDSGVRVQTAADDPVGAAHDLVHLVCREQRRTHVRRLVWVAFQHKRGIGFEHAIDEHRVVGRQEQVAMRLARGEGVGAHAQRRHDAGLRPVPAAR